MAARVASEDDPLIGEGGDKNDAKTYGGGQDEGALSPDGPVGIGCMTNTLVICLLVAPLPNMAFGYDVGSVGGVLDSIEDALGLTTFETELMIAQYYLGAAIGGLISGKVADAYGRRAALALSSSLFIVGIIFQGLAQSFEILLVGRMIAGLGAGVSWVGCGVYATEVAPVSIRGLCVCLVDIAINMGLVFGYVAALACFGTDMNWRGVIFLGAIFPIAVLMMLPFVPESPRWTMLKLGDAEAAKAALLLIESDSADAERRYADLARLKNASTDVGMEPTFGDVLKTQAGRGALCIAIAMGFLQQVSGTEAILYYSSSMLEACGVTKEKYILWFQVAISVCKLLGELIVLPFVDRVGRRPMLLGSSIGLSVGLGCMALAYADAWPAEYGVLLLGLIMFSFSLGVGPIMLVVVGESSSTRFRGMMIATCIFVNRITSGMVAFSFLSLKYAFGSEAKAFVFYTLWSLVALLFYYTTVPELSSVELDSPGSSAFLPPGFKYLMGDGDSS